MEEGHVEETQEETHAGGMQESEVDFGEFTAMVTVDPGMAGDNRIEIMFEPMEGGELPELDEVGVSASLPSQEIGPLALETEPGEEPDSYVVPNAALSLPGEWELRIEARAGEFDLFTESTMVEIGGG